MGRLSWAFPNLPWSWTRSLSSVSLLAPVTFSFSFISPLCSPPVLHVVQLVVVIHEFRQIDLQSFGLPLGQLVQNGAAWFEISLHGKLSVWRRNYPIRRIALRFLIWFICFPYHCPPVFLSGSPPSAEGCVASPWVRLPEHVKTAFPVDATTTPAPRLACPSEWYYFFESSPLK